MFKFLSHPVVWTFAFLVRRKFLWRLEQPERMTKYIINYQPRSWDIICLVASIHLSVRLHYVPVAEWSILRLYLPSASNWKSLLIHEIQSIRSPSPRICVFVSNQGAFGVRGIFGQSINEVLRFFWHEFWRECRIQWCPQATAHRDFSSYSCQIHCLLCWDSIYSSVLALLK